jgi:multiple sugar transport system permease protein
MGVRTSVLRDRLGAIGTAWRKSRTDYLMMAPYLILFAVFVVLPVISAIVLSFTDFNMIQRPHLVYWENYLKLFLDDDVYLIAVKNTLLFALITGPISYFLCLALAWLVNEFPPRIRSLLTLILYAPTISGSVFVIWKFLLSGDAYGLLNSILLRIGLLSAPAQWLTSPQYMLGAIIVVQLWLSLGAGFLAFIAGLQMVDHSLYEAGAIDGIRNRWQELWFITLPSMKGQLMFGAVIQIAISFSAGEAFVNLTGFPSTNYAAHTVVTHMMDYGTLRYEMGYASAIAVTLFAAMLLLRDVISRALKQN